jgi:tRNA/rRNA methyltransferase
MTTPLAGVRVVLVRPHYAGNVGSVARLMANFDLRDFVLVDPVASLTDPDARRLATNGVAVLDAARVVPDLRTALADCVYTLATGGLAEGVARQSVAGTPRDKLPALIDSLASGPVALVFGPEPHGLTTVEVGLCHGMIHIPTGDEFPSLNLAQAAAICLYELFTLMGDNEVSPDPPDRAPFADLDRMFGHLKAAFEAVHYVYGTKGDPLMHAFRHLVSRARPTRQEVRMLHGLARQLLWLAGNQKDASRSDQPERGV